MKKVLSAVGAAFLSTFVLIGSLMASTYTSTLELASGHTLTGAVRYYTAGINGIGMYARKLTPVSGGNSVTLFVELYETTGIVDYKIADTNMTWTLSEINQAKTHSFGYMDQGNRYYRFLTEYNGVGTGGIEADPVVMTSVD